MTSATDALGRTSTHSHDLVGRQTSTTDARGITINNTFDNAGQLAGQTSPNETRGYTYDPAGRRIEMVDASGTTTYTYDETGRPTTVNAAAGTVGYTFDAAGQRTTMTQPEGTVTYGYDANGFTNTVTDWRNDTVTFTNDADGRTLGIDRPNGVSTSHSHDNAGRISQIGHTGPAGPIDTYTYTYDGNGNRTKVVSNAGTESYVIDFNNRLIRSFNADGTNESFPFDAAGNPRGVIDRTGDAISYLVDDTGQLTGDNKSTTFTYDQAGNFTGNNKGETYVYDDWGRLSEATANGVTQTYTYDADNNRVTVDGNDQLLDRTNGLPTLISDGANNYLHVNGIARENNDWLLANAIGTVTNATNNNGDITATNNYNPYGQPQTPQTTTYGYAGEQTDTNGLIHLRARTYNPNQRRFLTTDPIQPGSPGTGGWNHYSYAANNPTTWTDPSGRSTLTGYDATNKPQQEATDDEVLLGKAVDQVYRDMWRRILLSLALLVTHTTGPSGGPTTGPGGGGGGGDGPAGSPGKIGGDIVDPEWLTHLASANNVDVQALKDCIANGRGSAACNALDAELVDELESRTARTTHPVSGVEIVNGFPVFDSAFDVELPTVKVGPDVSDPNQMRYATRQLRAAIDADPALAKQFSAEQLDAISAGRPRIPNYTWHHHQDGVTLQLVDRWTHEKTGHTGGRATTGGRP